MFPPPPPPPGPGIEATGLSDPTTCPPGTDVIDGPSRSDQVDSGDTTTTENMSDNEALILLSKKHEESLQLNEKLTSLLEAERLKTTQLQNQLALGLIEIHFII